MSVDLPDTSSIQAKTPQQANPAVAASAGGAKAVKAFNDDDGPSFSDFLDIINPLQHIPVINTLYRELTGDDEGAVADIAGGALYGGVIGMVASIADVFVEGTTGKRIGENVVALFSDDDDTPATAVAKSAEPAAGTGDQTASAAPGGDASGEAALAAMTTPPLQATGGEPVRAGDYLIFGAAPGIAAPKPQVTTSALASAPARASTRTASAAYETATRRGAATNGTGPRQRGDYLIFGSSGDAPAPTAPDAVTGATPIRVIGGNAGQSAPNAATDAKTTAATSASGGDQGKNKSWPVPPRTGPAVPQQVLPPPTTGPAALPGGHSMAVSRQNTAANVDGAEASQWFANAFNQAMDKYERTLRLQKDKDVDAAANSGDRPLN